MIRANSITRNFIIHNNENPRLSYEVVVQANKNGGICDFYLSGRPIEPIRPRDTSDGQAVRAYNAARKEYDANMRNYLAVRSELLNVFQGRQLASESVRIHIYNVLYAILNPDAE